MVQTKTGAANNEWLAFVRTAAGQYKELKQKQAAANPSDDTRASSGQPAAKKSAKRPRLSDAPVKR